MRFLPEYDNLFLSHDDRSRVTDRKWSVDWMRGSILVDGFLRGTWRMDAKQRVSTLRMRLFEALPKPAVAEVEAEATELLAFAAANAVERRIAIVEGDA